MNRRQVIAALLTISAAPVRAERISRVGYLYSGNLDNPADRAGFDLFRSELARLGFAEGKNVIIQTGFARGSPSALPALAKELIDFRADVIVAIATPAIAAAQSATSKIPIVMMPATDPIGSGFVKSLAHPGSNITGMANMYGDSIGKSVELLHSLLPQAKRVAVLMSSNPTHTQQFDIARTALVALGLVAVPAIAPNQSDLEAAFDTISSEKCDALFVLADPVRPPIVKLAAKAMLPAVYQYTGYVDLGGFASYGPEFNAILRKGAEYVAKILRGAIPADTPVEQPVVFELVVNLKTARELGINVPESILVRADRIVE